MAEQITDEDLELLGELGLDVAPAATGGRTALEQRIIAGFEEIERFVAEHGRAPQHGEGRDIFERLYAVRLDRIRASAECRQVLQGMDTRGLLNAGGPEADGDDLDDEALLAALGGAATPASDVTRLVHVRPREEINAAEEIAQRNPCRDFAEFEPLFEQVQRELAAGERQTVKYGDDAAIQKGQLFILDGQKLLVAEMGEEFVTDYDRRNRRLRVIYDNGTESDLLLRSLQRALWKDKASRRITEPGFGPLFDGVEDEADLAAGYIYVLRSKSDHPFVAQNREVFHKIGVTGGDVSKRLANAKRDPTYLLADVEAVATYKLANINRKGLEALLHRFFAPARLDLQLPDRFGANVEPREWFLVPLPAIDEAIQKLMDGTIGDYHYDPAKAQVVPR